MTTRDNHQPALILLSGLLCDEEVWTGVLPALRSNASITHFHFPSFSSIGAMAEHVLASAPARFAVAGHSMGGRVALEIARRAPHRVTGLALLNTGVHPPGPQEPATRGRWVDLARTHGMTALAAEWLRPMLEMHKIPDDVLMARLTRMVERNTPDSFAAQIQALLTRPDARETLPSIEVPVLLLSASGDTWSPPHQHASMRDACPNSQLVIVEGAGHMSPVEAPEAVAAALADWLQRVVIGLAKERDLSALDRLEIRDACTRQIYRAARFTDAGAWESLARLFTEGAVFYRPSDPETPIEGRDGILASLRARGPRKTLHLVTNIEVIVESRDRACAVSSVVLYSAASPREDAATIASTAVGTFRDQFIRHGQDWLFEERRGAIRLRST